MQDGYLGTVCGAHMWSRWLHKVSLLGGGGGILNTGRKSEAATQQPSREPKCDRTGCITPASSGIPNAHSGDNIKSGYPSVLFEPRCAQSACIIKACSAVPNTSHGEKSEMATRWPSREPTCGRSGYISPAFASTQSGKKEENEKWLLNIGWRAHMWAYNLNNPYLLRDPQH